MNNNQINKKTLIIILCETLLSIIAIIILANILSKKEVTAQISIDNISLISNLSENQRSDIANELYRIVAENTDKDQIIKNTGAIIRESTINENDTSGNFVVDIDYLQESYFIQYELPDNSGNYTSGYPTLITCPEKSLRIYDNQSCEDSFSTQPLEALLPYSDTTPSDQFFSIVKDEYFSPKNQHIIVEASICENYPVLSEEVNSAVQSWITSNNLSADNIKITANYSCFTQQ